LWHKPIFAGKKYFCQSGFYHGKNGFSTVWEKPANPAEKEKKTYYVRTDIADQY